MIDLKRRRFWLCLTGILIVLIAVITWLFVLPSQRLRSGDVLIYDQEKIWLLDPKDYTLSLLLELAQKGIVGYAAEFHVSPKHDFMYLMAHETHERNMLFRYDLRNKDVRVITHFAVQAQISRVFPDAEHALITMYPPELGLAPQCVLEFKTGDCFPVDPEIPIPARGGLWLSRDMVLTTSIDRGIKLLSFKENQFSVGKTIVRPGTSLYTADLISDCCVVLAAYQQEGQEEGKPVLLSLDRDSFELAELPIVPTDYGAAFNDISVSSNNRYIAYQQGLYLEIKEFCSGKAMATLSGVLYSAWIRDTDSLLAYVEHSDYPGDPDELVVLDASTGQVQTILTLDHQVWFETVP